MTKEFLSQILSHLMNDYLKLFLFTLLSHCALMQMTFRFVFNKEKGILVSLLYKNDSYGSEIFNNIKRKD